MTGSGTVVIGPTSLLQLLRQRRCRLGLRGGCSWSLAFQLLYLLSHWSEMLFDDAMSDPGTSLHAPRRGQTPGSGLCSTGRHLCLLGLHIPVDLQADTLVDVLRDRLSELLKSSSNGEGEGGSEGNSGDSSRGGGRGPELLLVSLCVLVGVLGKHSLVMQNVCGCSGTTLQVLDHRLLGSSDNIEGGLRGGGVERSESVAGILEETGTVIGVDETSVLGEIQAKILPGRESAGALRLQARSKLSS